MISKLYLAMPHSLANLRRSRYLLTVGTLTALSLAMHSAQAAGIEYTKQSIAPFFEPGNYAEVSNLMLMSIQRSKESMLPVIISGI